MARPLVKHGEQGILEKQEKSRDTHFFLNLENIGN